MNRYARAGGARCAADRGFTLIEILVAITIVAVLSVAVYPVVVQQLGKWEAMRVARDLAHLRLALEQFSVDTGNYPRQLTHLANPIELSDQPLASRTYSELTYTAREVSRWNGPYVDRTLAASLTDSEGLQTGFGGTVVTGVICLNPETAQVADCARGTWVALFVSDLRAYQFLLVNKLIDRAEADATYASARLSGRLMASGMIGIDGDLTPVWTFYLALPYLLD